MLASGDIAVTDTARSLAQAILYPPVPRLAAPAPALLRLSTVGLLPAGIRLGYGFFWSPRQEAMLRLFTGLVRSTLRVTPSIVRHWPAARRARRQAIRSL
jgi:uncharacterized protein (DUF2236 family)